MAERRRPVRPPTVAVGMAVVVLLVATGCSDSRSARDRDTVKAVSMRVEDLSPEWAPSPPDTSVETEGDNSRFAQCVGRPEPKTVRTAVERSPRFHMGERSRASSRVQAVRNVKIARDDFAALEGSRAVGCLRQRLQAQLDRESSPGNVPQRIVISRLPGITVGEATVAFRAELAYPTYTGYLDQFNVRKERVEMSVSFHSGVTPFPADFERSVLTRMVDRA